MGKEIWQQKAKQVLRCHPPCTAEGAVTHKGVDKHVGGGDDKSEEGGNVLSSDGAGRGVTADQRSQ